MPNDKKVFYYCRSTINCGSGRNLDKVVIAVFSATFGSSRIIASFCECTMEVFVV